MLFYFVMDSDIVIAISAVSVQGIGSDSSYRPGDSGGGSEVRCAADYIVCFPTPPPPSYSYLCHYCVRPIVSGDCSAGPSVAESLVFRVHGMFS